MYVSLKINLICQTQAQVTLMKIIKAFNESKAERPDGISAKFVKMSTNVIDCRVANIIHHNISFNKDSNSKTYFQKR